MKLKKPNLVMVFTVVGCVAVIGFSTIYYSKDQEAKPAPQVDSRVIVSQPKQDTQFDVRPSGTLSENNNTPSRVGETTLKDSEVGLDQQTTKAPDRTTVELQEKKSRAAFEERLAKFWFDIREGDNSEETVNTFLSDMQTFLSSNSIPQVVYNFPISLMESTDVGFSKEILSTPQGVVSLITLVMPENVKNRVVNFYLYEAGDKVHTGLIKGTNSVPEYLGVQYVSGATYFYLGGTYLDDKLNTEDASMEFTVLKAGEDKVEVFVLDGATIDPDLGTVEYTPVSLILKSDTHQVYFYNELVNEGERTDSLYLVFENQEENKLFTPKQQNGTFSFEELKEIN